MLFRFAAPCLYREKLWTGRGLQLAEAHRLPDLADLDGRPATADVRAAWSEEGIGFSVRVQGKRQAPWCRDSQMDESDGLQVWIDTRDTHNIHRASRFCHRFVFLPAGGGGRRDDPCLGQLLINRAREIPRPADPSQLKVRSEKRTDGYLLEAFVASGALTGYDPAEHPRLGFTYQVADRELGDQTLSVGRGLPYQEDPSLWATLELVR
jgi:hypothetical protein